MGEILDQSPVILEGEIQVEAGDQSIVEQLSFPKLDGVLFPIVVENADIIAPCSWMGGEEVSLTVALNNYYQPMAEENADEVIADVQAFLANQTQPEKEKPSEPDEAEERAPRQEAGVIEEEVKTDNPAADRNSNNEEVEAFSSEKGLDVQHDPGETLSSARPVQTVSPAEDHQATDTKDITELKPELADETPRAATSEESLVTPPPVTKDVDVPSVEESAPEAALPVAPVVNEVPVEPIITQEIEQVPDIVSAPTLSKADAETDHKNVSEVSLPSDTPPLPDSEVEMEAPVQQEELIAEPTGSPDDTPVRADEETVEFTDHAPEPAIQEADVVDYEHDFEPQILDRDDIYTANEEESVVSEFAEADSPELSAPADPVVEKIEQLLVELTRNAEPVEETPETEDDECIQNETETSKDLQELYAEILNNMQLVRKPEVDALLMRLTSELQLEDQAGILEKLEEIEDLTLRKAVHTTIKALAAIVTVTKRTLVRIGRSALWLHAVKPVAVRDVA